MLQTLRRALLAGATVAVLGFAVVGAGVVAGHGTAPTDTAVDVAAAADALLAADSGTATPTAAKPSERLTARQLRRLAAWQRLVHAQATLDLPVAGGLTTIQLDHGTVGAVSAGSLTIREAGGDSVTVQLGAETKVRRNGAKAAVADLTAGDAVFALSRVQAGGTEAYLVVVPKG